MSDCVPPSPEWDPKLRRPHEGQGRCHRCGKALTPQTVHLLHGQPTCHDCDEKAINAMSNAGAYSDTGFTNNDKR